jgi:hypothetical protein
MDVIKQRLNASANDPFATRYPHVVPFGNANGSYTVLHATHSQAATP